MRIINYRSGGNSKSTFYEEDIDTKVYSTADFIKKVLSVYTHSMATIYLSLSSQVAKSTFFMKSPVFNPKKERDRQSFGRAIREHT